MQVIELKGVKREALGKAVSKQVRKNEEVPAVLYGTSEPVHFTTSEKEFGKLIYTPHVHLVKLSVDGKTYDAVLQDVQYHPVSDRVLHVDFLAVQQDKPVTIEIPVKLSGLSEGVKAGGKLQLEQRKLKVKALAKYLPDTLDINIDKLGLGKTIQVKELSYPNLEILNAKNSVVVSVKLTRAARAAQGK